MTAEGPATGAVLPCGFCVVDCLRFDGGFVFGVFTLGDLGVWGDPIIWFGVDTLAAGVDAVAGGVDVAPFSLTDDTFLL